MKEKLYEEPLLQRPSFSKPFSLRTDASRYAIGGILSQGKIGKDKPIAYASQTLNDNEKKYDILHTKKEALAIVYCVTYFRPYFYGRKFTLVTEHNPLVWFQNSKDPCSRVTRWKLNLAEYDFDVTYKAEKTNTNADAISRNPIGIVNINDNEGINTSQVKLNKEDNILTELNTDDKEEAPYMNPYHNEEWTQEEIESIKFVNRSTDLKIYEEKYQSRKIVENNSRETEETTNGKNSLKNKDNQGSYYKLKYKINDDENINIGCVRGNKQILTDDEIFL